jgi:hypothetical protein
MIEKFLQVEKFFPWERQYLEDVYKKVFNSRKNKAKAKYAAKSAVITEAYKIYNGKKVEKINDDEGIKVGLSEVYAGKADNNEEVEFCGTLTEAINDDFAREAVLQSKIYEYLNDNDYITIKGIRNGY